MSIHEKINYNNENSIFVVVFKNRRWERIGGWQYDDIQFHRILPDRYEKVISALNKQGFYLG